MDTRASLIFAEFSATGLLTAMEGEDVPLSGIASVEQCGPGDLVFVADEDQVGTIRGRQPSAVVTSPALKDVVSTLPDLTLLIAPNLKLAHAMIRQGYVDRDVLISEWPAIHPSAVIGPDCVIGEGSRIGPLVVLGGGVRVGDATAVMAGAVVEHGAVIGNRTVVHPNVTIGYDCVIGDDVIIQSNAVIGAEGYGFAQDAKGRSHRIPQLGRVVIEDRASVGAGTCIDRATYGETRIGAGTKLDNLCHIAHNVEIGQDCLLTAMFVTGGSAKLGDRVVASGQTAVLDHLEVCSDVFLVRRAGVAEDIDQPGIYAGAPVEPYATYLKNTAVARDLSGLRKRVRQLEKEIRRQAQEEQGE
ncbi:MAG: UDP-3-O-(3-hydroxymyristoyl)glucosamine N-acyltransferase [marine benthic group bacterium]|nr:UDP-3-O-(3-hydroxymyristoyl)glucosamine N-acyltransferase [Gemmatimonadota bacterium]